MTFISLDSVGKKRGDSWVLQDISFGVKQAEIVAVIGTSGSGKSTLLRCINRLSEVSSGTITVDGKDIREYHPPGLRRRVGMVFQFPAIFPGTVRDNVEYGLKVWGLDPLGKVEQALHDADLDNSFLNRDAEKLSGGEQQRVCLARSLAIGSKALLLDEPTSSLDNKAMGRIEQTVKNLRDNRKLAIIWVTHDVEQARRVADRVVVLGKGQVTGAVDVSEFDWGDASG